MGAYLYSILTCESGGHFLVESNDQNPNEEDVVKRRGPLYLAIKTVIIM